MKKEKILITAALPYINNVPHMGHIVGSHLPADIFYRFCNSKGHDVTFVGGSDEHGTPAVILANQLKITPEKLVSKLHDIHKKIYEKLNIKYSIYSRTSSQLHHQTVSDFFRVANKNGYISKDKIEMYFCSNDNMFLPDRFVIGTCPKCGNDDANSDQCEKCGYVLNTNELVNPKCSICRATPTLNQSEHLYINLDKLTEKLVNWLEQRKSVLKKNVYSEAYKWINEGLKKRSITRDLQWGIKVCEEGFENKVFYVWFDAPIGYMTFTKQLGEEVFEKFWKDKDAKVYHFLGKDNIPFHTIFWPGMLLAHGEYNLPWNVVGYNYLNFEGQKFSKSKGIGVFCYNLLDSDIDIDTLRSYLTTVLPEGKDSSFTWDGYRTITNSELIGKFSNFFNRTLNMIWKNFDGKLDINSDFEYDKNDNELISSIEVITKEIEESYVNCEFREAYKKVMELSAKGNYYIDITAPWTLAKQNKTEELKKVLYLSLNLCKTLCICAYPILPASMKKLWTEQMNFDESLESEGIWEDVSRINVSYSHVVNKPSPLYKRIEDEDFIKLKEQLSKTHDIEELIKD